MIFFFRYCFIASSARCIFTIFTLCLLAFNSLEFYFHSFLSRVHTWNHELLNSQMAQIDELLGSLLLTLVLPSSKIILYIFISFILCSYSSLFHSTVFYVLSYSINCCNHIFTSFIPNTLLFFLFIPLYLLKWLPKTHHYENNFRISAKIAHSFH